MQVLYAVYRVQSRLYGVTLPNPLPAFPWGVFCSFDGREGGELVASASDSALDWIKTKQLYGICFPHIN